MEPALAPFLIPLMTTIGGFRLVSAMAVTCCDFAESMMRFIPWQPSGSLGSPAMSFSRWRMTAPYGQVVPFKRKRSFRSVSAG